MGLGKLIHEYSFYSVDDLRDLISCLRPIVVFIRLTLIAGACGVLFRDAHCQAPACSPSRASLLTGTQPASTGCYGFQPMWEAPGMRGKTTLPAWLREMAIKRLALERSIMAPARRPPTMDLRNMNGMNIIRRLADLMLAKMVP